VLLLVSFQRAWGVDPGFASDHLLTANVTFQTSRYADANQRRAFADRAIERILNLGKRMYYGVEITPTTRFFTVVGVVGQHAMRGVEDLLGTVGAYFVPHAQSELPVTRMAFAIRTMGDPPSVVNAVRAEIAAIDPDLPLFDVQTMEERISNQLTLRRTSMLLSVGFAVLALFLSALGTHGLLAYRLAQRFREFGIRLALGSSSGTVFTLVVSEGARVLAVGLGVGMVGAVALSHVISSQLYGTRPLDPVLLVATVAILAVVALLASMVSAKRAAQVNPVSVLNDA